jgi:hypothetical protein
VHRRSRVVAIALIVGAAFVAIVPAAAPDPTVARAAGPPELDLARPRVLAAGVDLTTVRGRLDREPYATIFRQLDARAHGADGVALDDHTIGSERVKAKATKDLAFEYALDRTLVSGSIAPFPDPTARRAVGDLVRGHLLGMYTRSRLAVDPPLGGTDRDINTSEELLQYSTAYDALLGAGYDFGADDAAIRTNLTDLASELYLDYRDPAVVNGWTAVLPNNHRSKSAAALGVAALALFDTPPDPGPPPTDVRDPAAWLTFALDQVDLVQRWTYLAGGGGYGEGPYYQRYASQNLLPFLRAWDHARGNRPWDVGGHAIPDLWQHPAYRATQRWMLDVTLPDGGLAPIDDGNVDFSHYFGLAPTDPASPEDAAAAAWRWAHAPTPYDTDGSIDLAADALAVYDDSVTPAPPTGSATRLDDEAGTAVFRSDWSPDAVEAVALGEHGNAMELGRDRSGLGQPASAAHEQPDTASYLLHAYGERLLLDPGYLTYEQRGLVGKAPDHNLVLVNGKGPGDPFVASVLWANDPAGKPAVDGQATMSELLDTPAWAGARVDSAYAGAHLSRRFAFVDDRYLVTFDEVQAAPGTPLTWVTHGNGGGTSGGTFTAGASGGEWTHGAARVDTTLATSAGAPALTTRTTNHEGHDRALLTHTALDATVTATAPTTRAIGIAYPTRIGAAPPGIGALPDTGDGRVRAVVFDPADDRIVLVTLFPSGRTAIREWHFDGSPRAVVRDSAKSVSPGGGLTATRTTRGPLALHLGADRADLVAPGTTTTIRNLGFVPRRADGACGLATAGTEAQVTTRRDGAVTLFPTAGNSAPAADPGPDVENAPVGTFLRLDAGRSCDRDHDALTARWRLLSAPPGSMWPLFGTGTAQPWLALDRPGPYRVRLTVTDAHGAVSRPVDLTVFAGPRCTGDRLDWSDPRC